MDAEAAVADVEHRLRPERRLPSRPPPQLNAETMFHRCPRLPRLGPTTRNCSFTLFRTKEAFKKFGNVFGSGHSPPLQGGVAAPVKKMQRSLLSGADGAVDLQWLRNFDNRPVCAF